jgi:hypothetical protein
VANFEGEGLAGSHAQHLMACRLLMQLVHLVAHEQAARRGGSIRSPQMRHDSTLATSRSD